MSGVTHVVGARPNFMKAAPVVHALAARQVEQRLIHTGQHYDPALSQVFFEELALPRPDAYLGVGSGSHAQQTAGAMTALEPELERHRPELMLVYGDVNSTLAAALVASKLRVRLGHVEAGLRSFDRSMPEEVNRVVADALADMHFVTSEEGIANLLAEGVRREGIHHVGNPMIDTLMVALDRLGPDRTADRFDLTDPYGVVTLHRPSNVDESSRLEALGQALAELAEELDLVFPVHPRGRDALLSAGLGEVASLRLVDPLGYLEFVSLVRGAAVVVTDSGGVQEETTVLGVPCLTVRPNTERPVTIDIGTNRLVEPDDLVAAARAAREAGAPSHRIPPLWDGAAGDRIADIVASSVVTAE